MRRLAFSLDSEDRTLLRASVNEFMSSLPNNCPTVNHWIKCDILGWPSDFFAALHIYSCELTVDQPFGTSWISFDALCVAISLETTLPIYAFDNPEDSNHADISFMHCLSDYERRMKDRPWITDEAFRHVYGRPWITGRGLMAEDTLPFYHCIYATPSSTHLAQPQCQM